MHPARQFTRASGRRLDIDRLAHQPGDRRWLEPLHRVFRAAYRRLRSADALDQLAYARGWFATYNVVGVRKALEDDVQAVLSRKAAPEAAMARAQAEAEALMKPYVEQTALKRRSDVTQNASG
jgi:hypothetical protein